MSLLIINTIDMHHHKHGKVILDFFLYTSMFDWQVIDIMHNYL